MQDGKVVYIHYGHDKFETMDPIKNRRCWVKPYGGLWASRKDDPDGWRSWCEREEFRLNQFEKSFEFTLKDEAKILILKDVAQLENLPEVYYPTTVIVGLRECWLDFEKLAKEYDAIELVNIRDFYWPLYGWDCNCILIMNPEIVIERKEKEENV